jgi:hypothetical protein
MVSFLLFNEMACSSPVCSRKNNDVDVYSFVFCCLCDFVLYVTDHCIDSYFAPVLGLYCSLSGYHNMIKR